MSDVQVKEIRVLERPSPRWETPGRGRGYWSTTWRSYHSKPRVYVHLDGESVLEDFANRFDRLPRLYRQALPQVLEALGLPADTKCRWSQRAGCSCGCSPAFVVDAPNRPPRDAWVTLCAPQPVTERGVARAAALLSDPTVVGALEATR